MATVISTALSAEHTFTKQSVSAINLIEGLGVEGDCHLGKNVQHRSRLHIQPPPANLRQVHLIQNEILISNELKAAEIGENITTQGVDLLSLGKGTKLHFLDPLVAEEVAMAAKHPVVTVTGLRNPCPQIEKHRKGLQEVFVERDDERKIVGRKAGVMSTVTTGGRVIPGMKIVVEGPAEHEPLACV
ncbi:hypothetical protein H2198_002116 [Neophaeococcomyces mojaviensis]|uniref:Uncharacterized protein n=1 Tax=Neophaeococcomyces mojaviensis TaxID=3383035 RepID=A0ACC3AFN7_9EURO|nr:hypothetical protein H2198_002116 [Knufia sp. JES_112]